MHSRNVSTGLEFTSCIVIVILFSLQFIIDYIRSSLVRICLMLHNNEKRHTNRYQYWKTKEISLFNHTKYCIYLSSPRRAYVDLLTLSVCTWKFTKRLLINGIACISFKITKLRFPRPLQSEEILFPTFLIITTLDKASSSRQCNI